MTLTTSRQAFIGGLFVFLVALAGILLIGGVYSDTQARVLIEAMVPSLRTLCFAIITASATIISLLLTTVGFAHRLDNDFDKRFYHQIKLIARLCAIVLSLSVAVLMVLTMPLTETEQLQSWFSTMYYVLILSSALLAAIIIAIIILIYRTVVDIIHVVYPEDAS